ncbi:MAG: hypothetical protein KIG95_00340 [Comamonas sp.]|nr:hypothetical protein [Comamonas sp.]
MKMGIPALLMLAFLGGAMLQLFLRRLPVAIVISSAALSLWILFTELLQPYKGGGASMWPIALFFIIVYSAGAATIGAVGALVINKARKSK